MAEWLPTQKDRDYVKSLMRPCYDQVEYADWIAPPPRGINSQPIDFGHARL